MSHLLKAIGMPIVLMLVLLSTACVDDSLDTQSKLETVRNDVKSHISYKPDSYQSDKYDYWQTAKQTLEYKTGDCEDFAILYAALLMEHGVKEDELQFGYYKNILTKEQHLVLIINSIWIADNYGVSYFSSIYREKYILQNTFPIVNSRSTKEFYNMR